MLFLYIFVLPTLVLGDYVPGEPGAAWTSDELLAVKAKLQNILRNPKGYLEKVPETFVSFHQNEEKSWYTGAEIYERYEKTTKEGGIEEGFHSKDALLPNVAKMIRLAFHDCIKDGETGGCNGCLNFEGMGTESEGIEHQMCMWKHFQIKRNETCARDSHPKSTDNNNLLWVSQVLEAVYTADNLPIPPWSKRNPTQRFTQQSLKATGKSRADLWAYAGLVAVELAGQFHNNLCVPCTAKHCRSETTTFCPGQVDENSPSCAYKMPPLTFKYGRRDCIEKCNGGNKNFGFCSPAEENHPNPQGNGKDVTKFFKEDFGLTARETIALMGAHTFGHANEQISGFLHYPWVVMEESSLNNEYYKGVVDKGIYRRKFGKSKDYKQACDMEISSFIGDEYGKPMHVDWVVRSQWQNMDGGPWNWNPFVRKCDRRICDQIGTQNWKHWPASCCHWFDKLCISNPGKCDKGWCDHDGSWSGEKDRFNCTMPFFGARSYMNIDMGLYVKFDVAAGDAEGYGQGRPMGCSGLNRRDWVKNKGWRPGKNDPLGKNVIKSYDPHTYLDFTSHGTKGNDVASTRYSDVTPGKRFSGCPLNDDIIDDGGEKMYEVFEAFANDNQLWVNEFVDVFQKMLENGYQPGNEKGNEELKESNVPWQEVTCSNLEHTCSIGDTLIY